MGYLIENYDEDGNPEVSTYVREEPDCCTCCDRGQVVRFPFEGGQRVENCPDCNPTPEQVAARLAAYEEQEAEFAGIREREARGEMPF